MDDPRPMFLIVDHLGHHYGKTIAVRDVSFTIAQGEFFGLLGPNGAGKTTLLSILACLLDPTSGAARLEGKRLGTADRAVRQRIGIVPQDLALYSALTARENLRFFGQVYGLRGESLDRRVREVLAAIGLEDRANQRVDTFSGGMKRRLNLGAALLHRPSLLLLDEPTTGVDPQSRNYLFDEIKKLHAAGTTILYTSHYMEEVQALCQRVGILDQGQLIALGTVPEMLARLESLVRFRISGATNGLVERLTKIPAVNRAVAEDGWFIVETNDPENALIGLLSTLKELQLDLLSLETREPNLERVFLHLTGRALRDE